jgi:restriction system protein
MGRSSGLVGFINAVARDMARAERARVVQLRREEKETARRVRVNARAANEAAKEARQRYLEARTGEAEDQTQEAEERLQALAGLMDHTLGVDDTIAFATLRLAQNFEAFVPPRDLVTPALLPMKPEWPPPSWFERILPWLRRKREARIGAEEAEYHSMVAQAEEANAQRARRLQTLRDQYDARKAAHLAKVIQRNQEVEQLERAYQAGDPDAVVAYNSMVLERSEYPDGFPQTFRLAYSPPSKELVVEYELPTIEVVPTVAEYRYIRTRDEIAEKPRKAMEVARDYRDVVGAVVLRSLHEVFEADQGDVVQTAVFNGMVQTVDPATGRDVRPCVISVRATKAEFNFLDLRRVDKETCLRNLGANVSARPDQVIPVKPVVELDMIDARFIEQDDVLGSLDGRPNLMDLTPAQFEALVSNLFQKMGLETKLTRTSRDGGVDAVAFDVRPVLGGKVVIQAKRYRHTVGVSAVRDLYGTMMNEGANKGVLVATSGYGPDAFEFAKDKPIELIAGGSLLYLLEQVGVRATIVFPPEAA